MPTIITIGASSATGFGFLRGTIPYALTQFGIFSLGLGGLTCRNKYTFSNCSVSAATSAQCGNRAGAAAGNCTAGHFALGYTSACASSTKDEKYTYASGTVAAGVVLNKALYNGSGGMGNNTTGYYAIGQSCATPTNLREKRTYSNCTVANAASLSSNSSSGTSAGNSTVGVSSIGCPTGSGTAFVNTRNKLTYASCTNATGGASTVASRSGYATGNATVGIFALYNGSTCSLTCRNKYTYSNCTVASTTAARTTNGQGAATGSCSFGIMALGVLSGCGSVSTCKFTYSNCTSVAGGNLLGKGLRLGTAVTNGIPGVNM
jgi:hypothetical protein